MLEKNEIKTKIKMAFEYLGYRWIKRVLRCWHKDEIIMSCVFEVAVECNLKTTFRSFRSSAYTSSSCIATCQSDWVWRIYNHLVSNTIRFLYATNYYPLNFTEFFWEAKQKIRLWDTMYRGRQKVGISPWTFIYVYKMIKCVGKFRFEIPNNYCWENFF